MTMPKNDPGDAVAREVWFESAGARLFAVERGEGPVIVFMHGGLADHRAAVARVGSLPAQWRVITPDMRGSGRSIHSAELSWDVLADDVAALLDHLGVVRAVVGGVSAGSAVAVRFALRHPRRLLGAVLVSPAFAGADRGPTDAQRAAFCAMDAHAKRALTDGIDALRPLYERLPEPIRDRALEMMRSFDPPSVAATTRFLASGAQPFGAASELETIDAPVLLIPGTDPEHPPEICALYAQHLRHAVVAEAGAGDVTAPIDAFLRSLQSKE
jgi:3-oxoadipate enol-lactonase